MVPPRTIKVEIPTGELPPLTSYSLWLKRIGVSRTTGLRWQKLKWLDAPTVNIAGKLYLTREQIERFYTRAAAGEFAKATNK
ncbi:MAG TPA: hypothetical protein VEH27_00880 [Methylomirabilota bacterium]|nr:hypothetical protein [Methylomirabilota bacterium]